MRKALVFGITLLVASVVVLGGTVFRQPVADAAGLLNVFVTNDSSHPVPVRETNTDASGNIKVHEQGTANVNISNATVPVHEQGTVTAQPAVPAGQFSVATLITGGFANDKQTISGPDPSGTSYAITNLTFANPLNGQIAANVAAVYGATTDCGAFPGPANVVAGPKVEIPANGTVTLTFPQPYVLPAQSGDQSCLLVTTDQDIPGGVSITVVGYRF